MRGRGGEIPPEGRMLPVETPFIPLFGTSHFTGYMLNPNLGVNSRNKGSTPGSRIEISTKFWTWKIGDFWKKRGGRWEGEGLRSPPNGGCCQLKPHSSPFLGHPITLVVCLTHNWWVFLELSMDFEVNSQKLTGRGDVCLSGVFMLKGKSVENGEFQESLFREFPESRERSIKSQG